MKSLDYTWIDEVEKLGYARTVVDELTALFPQWDVVRRVSI